MKLAHNWREGLCYAWSGQVGTTTTFSGDHHMTRRINAAGLSLVKQWEGLKTKAYQDVAGIWTIGYGHTSAAGAPVVKPGMVITESRAEEILRADLAVFEERVERLVKVPLSDNQHAVLVSFDFNTGALGKSTLLKKLNAGQYDAVPLELMKWVNAGGQRVKGLVNRRAAEASLWAKGTPTTTPTAPYGGFWATIGRFLLALLKGGKK